MKLQMAAEEGPIVIVNCSNFGSHVITVFADRRPSLIQLDDAFREQALRIDEQFLSARRMQDTPKIFENKLASVLQHLWMLVVSKVVSQLEAAGVSKRSRIWWCPTSFLTKLPFHAAGFGRTFLMDKFISSYTPTLKALVDARRLPLPSTRNIPDSDPRILVVAQTENSGLQYAGPERDIMCGLGPFVDALDDSAATRATVLANLSSHDWVHFICHGTSASNPFDSSLHLHEEDLSLHDIIKAHLPNARFAFLAACHTAEQSISGLQDEILHLASAMQISGFRSVVGTMWAMEDEDGPELAKRFYEEMLKGDSDTGTRHTRAAHALCKVTRRMRKEGVPMERWVNFVHIGA